MAHHICKSCGSFIEKDFKVELRECFLAGCAYGKWGFLIKQFGVKGSLAGGHGYGYSEAEWEAKKKLEDLHISEDNVIFIDRFGKVRNESLD